MFIKSTVFVIALTSCLQSDTTASTSTAVPLIAPHTYEIAGGMVPGREPDGNTYILEGPSGLTVIDTGRHAAHRIKIENFAAEKRAPIVAVINSHWHLDHVSGNIGLRKAYPNVKVYASAAVNEALTGFLAKKRGVLAEDAGYGEARPRAARGDNDGLSHHGGRRKTEAGCCAEP